MTKKSWLTRWKNLLQRSQRQLRSTRRTSVRTHTAEVLESRALLSGINCLGQIDGFTFHDANGNGTMDGASEILSGVTVHIYQDVNRDGLQSSGGVAAADDVFVGTVMSDAAGAYSSADIASFPAGFGPGLREGFYYVEQIAPTGFFQRAGENFSAEISITAADALGTQGLLIDEFTEPAIPGQVVTAIFPGTPTDASVAAAPSAIGAERDMFVQATSGTVAFSANGASFPNNLNYNANFGATGRARVVWDGTDGAATTLDPTGLSGLNFRAADELGFLLEVGTSMNTTLDIVVHTDGSNSSSASIALTPGAVAPLFVAYTDFSIDAGTGANFSSVGAVELVIEAPAATTTLVANLLQTQAPTIVNANFANFQPMTVSGTIFRDDDDNGVFGAEPTVNGVAVTLFQDDGTTPGQWDAGDTQLFTQTPVGDTYSFGNATTEQIFPGDYIVQVDASNFAAAGPLEGLVSSTGVTAADLDTDNVDDGEHVGGNTTAVVTTAFTLTNLAEPDTPVDGDDTNTNSTIDFGFFGSVDIAVTKSDSADPVTAGSGAGNLVYTVTATNNGPLDATGVEVTDALIASLPAGWSLDSAAPSAGTSFAVGTGIWTIGNLNNGGSATLTLTITVGTGAAATTTTNTAAVTGVDQTDSNAANDSVDEMTTVNHRVDIAVTKSDNNDPVAAGSGASNLVYTVTATNNGPSNATGVEVTDALIAGLPTDWTLVSAIGSGTTTFTGSTWTIGDLDSGAAETLTVTVTVGASANAGVTTNTAVVSAVDQTDTNAGNDSVDETTTVNRQVDIAVTKADNNDPVTAGSGTGNLVYTVTATNNGPSDATGVAVQDALLAALPPGWTLDSTAASAGTTFTGDTWTIGNLASGGSATLTATITVGASAAAGTVMNTASVTAVTETDGNATNDTATEDTVVSRVVDIALTKGDNADPISAGSGVGNLVYTVTATNNGPSDASGVTVTDVLMTSLPTGWTLDSGTGTGGTTFSAATGVWTIGNLANGASEMLTLTLTVDATAVAETRTNTASVTGLNETDSDGGNDTASESTTVGRVVDIALAKSDNTDPVTAGSGTGNLVYTVTATNNGPADATGVQVTDTLIASLPTGWTFESASASGTTSFAGGTGIWTIGNLPNGVTETLTITVTVDASAVAGPTTNTVNVTGVNETDSNAANDTAAEPTTIQRIVDISVTKTDNSDPIVAGSGTGNLAYTVTATNNGPSNATGVVLQDALIAALPPGWSLASSSATAGSFSGAGVWTIGNMNSRATETLTLTITIAADAVPGTTTNTATVTNVNETESTTANNTASENTTVDREVDIEVTKSDNIDPVTAGSGTGNLIYTVEATNNGPSNATGVSVTDALIASLPAGFALVSAVGTGGTTFNATSGIWTIGDLNPAATETLTVTITVGAAASTGTITNTAIASVTETDTNATNDTANETTTIDRRVDIAVTKSDNTDPIVAGSGAGNLVYTITATNNGPSDASGLELTDAFIAGLPAGFSVVSATGTGGSTFNTGTGVWTIGNLANGDSETLTISITVDVAAAGGTVANTVLVSALNETDADPSNDSASENTTVERRVDISVTKSDTVDPIVAGSGTGNLVYTIIAANAGPSDASGLEITDAFLTTLPAGFSVQSVVGSGGTTFNSGTGIWIVGNLANGASQTLTVTLTADQSVPPGIITNIAAVTNVDQTDTDPTNDTASESTTINREVDLVVTKTDFIDPIRSPGQVQYTITVSNNGPSQATNVVMTDNLSALVSHRSSTSTQGTISETGGVVTAALGSISAGSSATVTIIVDVNLPAGGIINNIASAVATETDTDPSNSMDDEDTNIDPAFSSISGFVYQDVNGDGIQDPGEPGIPDTIVGLYGTDLNGNNVVQVTMSSSNGQYTFDQLMQGHYNLFEIQPGIYLDGTDTVGTGASVGSVRNDAFFNVDLTGGASASGFNFGEGPEDESKLDFLASNQLFNQELSRVQPVTGTGTLSGNVAVDSNASGTFDSGDTGIGGVTVGLAGVDSAGNSVLIYRTTDVDGSYAFRNLAQGTYSIVESQPPGYIDGNEQTGTLVPSTVLDDVFAGIALPTGGVGSGYNFLESPDPGLVAPVLVPVLSSQPVASGSRPVLSWQGVADAVEYDVWLSQYGSGLVFRDEHVSGTSIQVPNDLALDNHRLWVRGIDSSGHAGPWSDGMDFLVSASPKIQALAKSTIDTTPTISWSSVVDATSYDLMIYDSSGNQILNVEGLTGTSYTVPTALNVNSYQAWVRARNGSIIGEWCNGAEFQITGAPKTRIPVGGSTLASTLLEWTDTGAESYTVWVNDVTGTPTVLTVEDVQKTSYLLPQSNNEGTLRFWVQGKDAEGNKTAWSAPRTFTMSARASNLAPAGNISANPAFTWDAVPGATRYDLWVSDSSGLFARETNVSGNSHTFANDFPDGDYQAWVKPYGANSQGKWSAVARFTKGGLATPSLTAPVSPTSDRTPTFAWTEVTGATQYELWVNHEGVTNRIIHETALTTNSFTALTDLAPGTYRMWVRALNGSGQQSAWSQAATVIIT